MKKEMIETRVGEFTDFTGAKRKYVIAAVSEVIEGDTYVMSDDDIEDMVSDAMEYEECDLYVQDQVVKKLSVGFSICNAGDEFNEKIGTTIAIGKARKKPHNVIYATSLGIINTTVVNAILTQEMNHFENAPGTVITGYNDAMKKYEAKNTQK